MADSSISCNSGAYTIIGAASKLAFALSIAAGSFAITGTAASTIHGYTLTAVSGSYTVTGTAINTRRVSAAPAGYLIGGQTVNLVYGSPNKKVTAVSGTYAITGTTATRLEKAVPISIGGYSITGTAANLIRNSSARTVIATSGSYALTGSAASAIYAEFIDSGDYRITGGTTTLRHGWSAQIGPGAYLVTAGPPVKLEQSRHFPSAGGSYSLTGAVVTLRQSTNANKIMTGDSTPYFLTGQDTSLLMARRLDAVSGTYTIVSGHTVFTKPVQPGSYSITGTDIAFHQNRRVTAVPGVYLITGDITDIRKLGKNLATNGTAYTLFGFQASLRLAHLLIAEQGLYSLNGQTLNLRVTHLTLDSGIYTYTGTAATLNASRAGRWRKSPRQPVTMTPQPDQTSNWSPQPNAPGVN